MEEATIKFTSDFGMCVSKSSYADADLTPQRLCRTPKLIWGTSSSNLNSNYFSLADEFYSYL